MLQQQMTSKSNTEMRRRKPDIAEGSASGGDGSGKNGRTQDESNGGVEFDCKKCGTHNVVKVWASLRPFARVCC